MGKKWNSVIFIPSDSSYFAAKNKVNTPLRVTDFSQTLVEPTKYISENGCFVCINKYRLIIIANKKSTVEFNI